MRALKALCRVLIVLGCITCTLASKESSAQAAALRVNHRVKVVQPINVQLQFNFDDASSSSSTSSSSASPSPSASSSSAPSSSSSFVNAVALLDTNDFDRVTFVDALDTTKELLVLEEFSSVQESQSQPDRLCLELKATGIVNDEVPTPLPSGVFYSVGTGSYSAESATPSVASSQATSPTATTATTLSTTATAASSSTKSQSQFRTHLRGMIGVGVGSSGPVTVIVCDAQPDPTAAPPVSPQSSVFDILAHLSNWESTELERIAEQYEQANADKYQEIDTYPVLDEDNKISGYYYNVLVKNKPDGQPLWYDGDTYRAAVEQFQADFQQGTKSRLLSGDPVLARATPAIPLFTYPVVDAVVPVDASVDEQNELEAFIETDSSESHKVSARRSHLHARAHHAHAHAHAAYTRAAAATAHKQHRGMVSHTARSTVTHQAKRHHHHHRHHHHLSSSRNQHNSIEDPLPRMQQTRKLSVGYEINRDGVLGSRTVLQGGVSAGTTGKFVGAGFVYGTSGTLGGFLVGGCERDEYYALSNDHVFAGPVDEQLCQPSNMQLDPVAWGAGNPLVSLTWSGVTNQATVTFTTEHAFNRGDLITLNPNCGTYASVGVAVLDITAVTLTFALAGPQANNLAPLPACTVVLTNTPALGCVPLGVKLVGENDQGAFRDYGVSSVDLATRNIRCGIKYLGKVTASILPAVDMEVVKVGSVSSRTTGKVLFAPAGKQFTIRGNGVPTFPDVLRLPADNTGFTEPSTSRGTYIASNILPYYRESKLSFLPMSSPRTQVAEVTGAVTSLSSLTIVAAGAHVLRAGAGFQFAGVNPNPANAAAAGAHNGKQFTLAIGGGPGFALTTTDFPSIPGNGAGGNIIFGADVQTAILDADMHTIHITLATAALFATTAQVTFPGALAPSNLNAGPYAAANVAGATFDVVLGANVANVVLGVGVRVQYSVALTSVTQTAWSFSVVAAGHGFPVGALVRLNLQPVGLRQAIGLSPVAVAGDRLSWDHTTVTSGAPATAFVPDPAAAAINAVFSKEYQLQTLTCEATVTFPVAAVPVTWAVGMSIRVAGGDAGYAGVYGLTGTAPLQATSTTCLQTPSVAPATITTLILPVASVDWLASGKVRVTCAQAHGLAVGDAIQLINSQYATINAANSVVIAPPVVGVVPATVFYFQVADRLSELDIYTRNPANLPSIPVAAAGGGVMTIEKTLAPALNIAANAMVQSNFLGVGTVPLGSVFPGAPTDTIIVNFANAPIYNVFEAPLVATRGVGTFTYALWNPAGNAIPVAAVFAPAPHMIVTRSSVPIALGAGLTSPVAGTARADTGGIAHNILIGDTVRITGVGSGADLEGYEGSFEVTAITSPSQAEYRILNQPLLARRTPATAGRHVTRSYQDWVNVLCVYNAAPPRLDCPLGANHGIVNGDRFVVGPHVIPPPANQPPYWTNGGWFSNFYSLTGWYTATMNVNTLQITLPVAANPVIVNLNLDIRFIYSDAQVETMLRSIMNQRLLNTFSTHGDSGSWIMNAPGGPTLNAVGLLYSGYWNEEWTNRYVQLYGSQWSRVNQDTFAYAMNDILGLANAKMRLRGDPTQNSNLEVCTTTTSPEPAADGNCVLSGTVCRPSAWCESNGAGGCRRKLNFPF